MGTTEEAHKSLELTGIQLGDKLLNIVKWFDSTQVRKLCSSSLVKEIYLTNQISHTSLTKMSSVIRTSTLETMNNTTKEWLKNWQEKKAQQYDVMERYSALIAAS